MSEYTPRFPVEICELIFKELVDDSIETITTLASIPQLAPFFQDKLCFIIIEDKNFTSKRVVDQAMENLKPYGNVAKFRLEHPLLCSAHEFPLSGGRCIAAIGYDQSDICGSRNLFYHEQISCLENDVESRKSILYHCQRFSHVVIKIGSTTFNSSSNFKDFLLNLNTLIIEGYKPRKTHYPSAFQTPNLSDLSESWKLLNTKIGLHSYLMPSVPSEHQMLDFALKYPIDKNYKRLICPPFDTAFVLQKKKFCNNVERNLIVNSFITQQSLMELSNSVRWNIPIRAFRFIQQTAGIGTNNRNSTPSYITEEFESVLRSLNDNMKSRCLEALTSFLITKMQEDISQSVEKGLKKDRSYYDSHSSNHVHNLIISKITSQITTSKGKILKALLQHERESQEYLGSMESGELWVDFRQSIRYLQSQNDSIDNLIFKITLDSKFPSQKDKEYQQFLEQFGADYIFQRIKNRTIL